MKGIPVALATRTFESNLRRLTDQERRILSHMLKAETSKETAFQLGIAISTTKNLRSRVLEKMMAENTGTLLHIAARARSTLPATTGED